MLGVAQNNMREETHYAATNKREEPVIRADIIEETAFIIMPNHEVCVSTSCDNFRQKVQSTMATDGTESGHCCEWEPYAIIGMGRKKRIK